MCVCVCCPLSLCLGIIFLTNIFSLRINLFYKVQEKLFHECDFAFLCNKRVHIMPSERGFTLA